MTKQYVVGFAFTRDLSEVVLIEKHRPDWQKGLYNGVGGLLEGTETFEEAMAREFEEETGIKTAPAAWYKYHSERYINDTGNLVHFLATVIDKCELGQPTDEKPVWYPMEVPFEHSAVLYNLCYLVPMAIAFIKYPKHRYVEV